MLAFGCSKTPELPPLGQLLLYIDTDAPLPTTSEDGVPALFDHVRIDGVLADGSSCNCQQEFDLTEENLKTGSASFGVFPPPGGGGKVRVRLYRIEDAEDDQPPLDSTIDVTFALPSTPAEGIVERTLFLPTDEVGNPAGEDAPVATLPGRPSPSRVGTWLPAARVDCSGAPRAGEACVPGGAFWMGNRAAGERGQNSGDAERLVTLAPFFLDETEVTVATLRATGGAADFFYSGTMDGTEQSYCTFTPEPGPLEDYPVNCISWVTARQYCQSLGKDLPTEAQFEYVAGALSSRIYVWGSDEPACPDAILERAGIGAFQLAFGTCRTTKWGGAMPVASAARDSLVLGSGVVHDLVGNLEESVLDTFEVMSGPCWSRRGVYANPVCGPLPTNCLTMTGTTPVSYRGGTWTADGYVAVAAYRGFAPCNTVTPERGFRCARADR